MLYGLILENLGVPALAGLEKLVCNEEPISIEELFKNL
jgi:hypothetical protein